jgi:hypothetical protein
MGSHSVGGGLHFANPTYMIVRLEAPFYNRTVVVQFLREYFTTFPVFRQDRFRKEDTLLISEGKQRPSTGQGPRISDAKLHGHSRSLGCGLL